MKRLHYFSLSTAPIWVYCSQGKLLSTATSFFYESTDSQLFLITNWHVVTGRNPLKPSHSKTGSVPCFAKIKVHKKQEKVGVIPHIVTSEISELSIPINSADGEDPKWLEHPKHKQTVDVVAIRLGEISEVKRIFALNVVNKWKEYQEDFEPEAMDDVYVIGYPWGLSSTAERGGGIPIYKRGCISSDPVVDFQRLPSVLIDCRTTSAMSGSPVIASRSGIHMPEGKLTSKSVIGTVSKFLGVYSGRLFSDEKITGYGKDISEIGIVWKESVLTSITLKGIPGTSLRNLGS